MAAGLLRVAAHVLAFLAPALLVACTRRPSDVSAVRAQAKDAGAPSAPVVAAPDAGVAPSPMRCMLVAPPETVTPNAGEPWSGGYDATENVRVLVAGDTTYLSWEVQGKYRTGDTSRSPSFAVRKGTSGPFTRTSLPTLSMACATRGRAHPGTADEPFVAWGVMNTRAFERWRVLPRTTEKDLFRVEPESSNATETPKQSVHDFVVQRNVALATTADAECKETCNCERWKEAVWLYGLDPTRPFAVRLATPGDGEASAPALAMGEAGGAAAFRSASALHLVWLDPDGRPRGAPIVFDRGDVGAPTLALAGRDLVVVWAKRETKSDSYRLSWMHLRPEEPPGGVRTLPTRASAFAPSVLADEASMTLAWMEGDQGRTGEIRVLRAPFPSAPDSESTLVSVGESNARDPELAGDVSAPSLVYTSFSKERPGGVVRLARLGCATAPH